MLFMRDINFFSCVQLEDQTIESYVTHLKILASTCEFAEQENGLIRDCILLRIKDSGLQERLLRENNLGFEKVIEIVRVAEVSREQICNMKYETATVNFVEKKENPNQPKKSSQYECKKCGRKYKPRECPAFGKICTKCKNKNHFAVKCFQNTKNIHEMNVPENELDVYIDSVSVNKSKVKSKLSETNLSLTTYGNFKLKPDGSLIINCTTNKLKNIPLPFDVVNVKSKPILGLKGWEFPSEPYHITLKGYSVPVIHPPRRVPQALQPKLKSTLNNLDKEGIVSKVNKPTDWVQNLKDGFLHVPLDEVSSEICTFNTPLGRYKLNKLPFGIVSAPEVFQKRNQKLFRDVEGVEIYFDDIIVAGYNEDSHDAIMSKVLERARSLNIKFNPDKLQYRVSEVKYVGQIISKSGIKPDPDHIKAIVVMPTPKSKTEVRRLLGMVNFLSKFMPNVSKVTVPLREIIHENVEFNWGKEQELSFVNIKELLAKAPILKVFNASDEIVIQCDISKDRLRPV
ncbi:transposon Tf2-6 polyprotein [Nephila pilipes]|uniref:Transposon Tf2-6 polyprotein n=1 Tax=Nephila pilipes TaxID=299642 RepID=A0A8X6M8S0_NEPPI|nr:transposon Tf2-6 polyprotein [Nephila pilipes]